MGMPLNFIFINKPSARVLNKRVTGWASSWVNAVSVKKLNVSSMARRICFCSWASNPTPSARDSAKSRVDWINQS